MSWRPGPDSRLASRVLIVFYPLLLAACLFGFLILNHKGGSVSAGLLCALAALIACALLGWAFLSTRNDRQRQFWLPLCATMLGLTAVFGVAELALRLIVAPTELGERIGAIALLPHDWNQVRRTNATLLQQFRNKDAFYVEDALLGWDVGRNRMSGLYVSSAEGIRSAANGALPVSPGPRVALLGDSFTFGEEVTFEHTWGHYLQQLLGARVLNFGVPAHGLDQTLVKFEHKVKLWNPQVLILGMLDAATARSGTVYFFMRPDQGLPFSKPRFIVKDGELAALNLPVLSADRIYAGNSIFDLPLLDHEVLFYPSHWQAFALDSSYFMRYLFSRFPKWDAQGAHLKEDAITELSARLIETLAEKAESAGSKLLIIFLPERADVAGRPAKHRDAIAALLARKGRVIFDPTACMLSRVPAQQLFVEGGAHYNATGNAALAECLMPQVIRLLAAQSR